MKVFLYEPGEDESSEVLECQSFAPDDYGFLWLYSRPNKPSHIINLAMYAQVEFEE